MTKKLASTELPNSADAAAVSAYHNTFSRYVAIKEEQAHLAKTELLVLWTDYFKPSHLADFPELHDVFWRAAKLCSACKVEISVERATELMDAIKQIHEMSWKSKGRDIVWYAAS